MRDVEGTSGSEDPQAPDPATSAPEPRPAVPAGVIDVLPDAVMVVNPDHVIVAWNPSAESVYGITRDEAVGMPLDDVLETTVVGLGPTDTAGGTAPRRVAPWHGRVIDQPRIGPFTDREIVVELTMAELRAADGTLTGRIAFGRPMTIDARLDRALEVLAAPPTVTDEESDDTLADRALAMLREVTEAAFAAIVVLGDDALEVLSASELSPELRDVFASLPTQRLPVIAALSRAGHVVSAHPDALPFLPPTKAALAQSGTDWVTLAGIRLATGATGFLVLGWARRPGVPPTDALVARTASEIARAIDQRRLVREIRQRLEEERRLAARLEALVGLAMLPAATTTTEAARLVLVELVGTLGAAAGIIAEERDGRFRTLADQGVTERFSGLEDRPVGSYRAWQRFTSGERAFLQPYEEGAVHPEALAQSRVAGYTAFAAFPIHADGALWGVAAVFFDQPLDRVALDGRTLDAIARIVENALANIRLRERVLASEHRYRTLFVDSPVPYFLLDPDENVVEVNEPAGRLYGEPAAALVGRSLERLTDSRRDDVEHRRAELATGGRSTFRTIGVRTDGSRFPMEVVAARLWIEGRPRDLSFVRDLTDEERLQGELAQAQKMEAIGQLVSGVAHELNNPLAAIIAFSQLIVRDPRLPADLKHDAGLLVQESDRTRRIVQNLLDFARQRPPERHPTAIRALIDSILDLQAYTIAAAQVEVVIDLPDDLPRVALDRAQMQQVLLNLTHNAIHAMRTGSNGNQLTIAGLVVERGSDRAIRISITDDGPGVAPEHRDQLFVPFFSTKPPGEGTGLGLPVSFGIVAAHDGSLTYAPGPGGHGATFTVELPLASTGVEAGPATEDGPAPAGARPPSPVASANLGPARVLVLDDEPSIRRFLAKALSAAGHDPVVAADGREALAIVRDQAIDVILCDHRMAGMSGTEFHDAAVALRPELARRFVFMSGDVLNPRLLEFATARGIGLLAKPFDLEAVSTTVHQVLEGVAVDQPRGYA